MILKVLYKKFMACSLVARRAHVQEHPRWPAAAVFDLDGLLVDTTACWHGAYASTLASHGRRLSADAEADLAGASVESAASLLGVPARELHASLSHAFASAALEAMPGAHRVVGALR